MSPTIFTRLRNRFSSTPTAIEASKPSPDEEAKDLEVLQKAIGDAVTAALNNDDFTTKVASHLASQIQPSIETALDMSALDSKFLASNEQLSHITTSIEGLENKIKVLQEQIASPDISLLSSHTTKLDTIATGLQKLQEEGPVPVGAALSSHTTKLDSIVTELAAIKDDIESGTAESNNGLSDVSTQVEKVIEAVESQNITLAEIKASDASKDILAGISTSNESHAAHTSAIDEIKTINSSTIPAIAEIKSQLDIMSTALPEIHATTASTAPAITDLKSQIDALNTTLSEMRTADSSSDILAGIKLSNESHATHATAFDEIRAANEATAPSIADLKSQIDTVSATISEIKNADISSEILTELKSSNEATSPAIADLKSQLETVNTALSEIRTADATPEILANLKASNESHAAHAATLTDIKTTVGTPAPVAEKVDLTTLEASVQNISASSTEVLAEVKSVKSLVEAIPAPAATKDDEILTEVKSVKSMIESVPAPAAIKDDEILTEVKLIKSLVEALPTPATVKDDEILTQVKAVKILVEKNALVTKVEEVGGDDKAVDGVKPAGENSIKARENGVNVESGEVEASA